MTIRLQPRQADLLIRLVEASHKAPVEGRERFRFIDSGIAGEDPRLAHSQDPAIGLSAAFIDIQLLARLGLLIFVKKPDGLWIDITPDGYSHYTVLKSA
jgi:hypothetical protein